jgi:hypothetical protein
VIDPEDIDWTDESATKGLRFRQAPGDENALGLVKFIFPNHFNVYLHDTPADRLFAKPRRALSHGCIRVEKPEALAEFVMGLDHPEWTPERINAAMHANREQAVTLRRGCRSTSATGRRGSSRTARPSPTPTIRMGLTRCTRAFARPGRAGRPPRRRRSRLARARRGYAPTY